MTESSQRKSMAQHTGDLAKLVTGISGALMIIGAVLVWALEHRARELTRDLAGTDEVIAAVSEVAVEQQAQRAVLEDVVVRVDRLEPDPRISEYDELRSGIQGGECVRGEDCHWRYLVRRTPYGADCAAPVAERVVRDSAGISFFPRNTEVKPIRRLDREWASVSGSFRVPARAASGVAEFYLDLVYSECGPNHDISIAERSKPLVFTILPSR